MTKATEKGDKDGAGHLKTEKGGGDAGEEKRENLKNQAKSFLS